MFHENRTDHFILYRTLDIGMLRRVSTSLALIYDLPSIFRFDGLGSLSEEEAFTDNGAQAHTARHRRDGIAEASDRFTVRDRRAQTTGSDSALQGKRRRFHSLDWNFASGQACETSHHTIPPGLPSLLACWRLPGNPPPRGPPQRSTRDGPPIDGVQPRSTGMGGRTKPHLVRRALSEGELHRNSIPPINDGSDDEDDGLDGSRVEIASRLRALRAIRYHEMECWFERLRDLDTMLGDLVDQEDRSKAKNQELQTQLENHQNQSRAEKNELQTQLENQSDQSRVEKDKLRIQFQDQLAREQHLLQVQLRERDHRHEMEKTRALVKSDGYCAQKALERTLLQRDYDVLQRNYDDLHQKFFSAGKFTTKHSIWLLVRVRGLPKDGDQSTSAPPLTDLQVSCTARTLLLTCSQTYMGPGFSPAVEEPFEIDHYIGPESTNRDVYRAVEPLIEVLFSGYDVCVFTDGQSGSGKSWTMFRGTDAVAPSIATSVMEWKAMGDAHGWECRVHCSAIEIYQDRLKDLLATNGEGKVEISKTRGGQYLRSATSAEELIRCSSVPPRTSKSERRTRTESLHGVLPRAR